MNRLFANMNLYKFQQKILLGGGVAFSSFFISQLFSQNITHKSNVYGWGWGAFGQLGIGNEKTQHQPQKLSSLEDEKIIFIDAKKGVSAAVSQNGQIFTWGKSKGGVLGTQDNTSVNVSIPTAIQLDDNDKIVKIFCGQLHMIAVTDKGEVYTWGNDSYGKLGVNIVEKDKTVSKTNYNTRQNLQLGQPPHKINFGNDVKFTMGSCGNQHSVLVDQSGNVYSFGQNRRGVLGIESTEQQIITPTKIESLNNVSQVCSGIDFNLALTKEGKVYGWGSNDYGQLGINSTNFSKLPTLISNLSNIVEIACGDYYGAAINKEGKLFTWGYGNDGQLGHSNNLNVRTPKEVQFDTKIIQVACGGGHTAFITDKNQLYLFGRGKEGQLGIGDDIESEASYRNTPKQVMFLKNKKVTQVKCGGEHTLALVEE